MSNDNKGKEQAKPVDHGEALCKDLMRVVIEYVESGKLSRAEAQEAFAAVSSALQATNALFREAGHKEFVETPKVAINPQPLPDNLDDVVKEGLEAFERVTGRNWKPKKGWGDA